MLPVLDPTPENLRRLAAALRAGRLVGIPTETVYGLAGHALDPAALARIFEVKARPHFDPLIVHVGARDDIDALCGELPDEAPRLMERFWPGPLTLVLPRTTRVPDLATAGLPTVAVRMPAHPVARALLREAGVPLAAPSANPFGALSPTTAAHVAGAFADGVEAVLDGGPCDVGVESTVVGWVSERPTILRAGGLSQEELEDALGRRLEGLGHSAAALEAGATQATPGALPWHYAPRTPLRLRERDERPAPRAGLLCFGEPPRDARAYARVENLSPAGNLREAAAGLFAALHRLDAAGLDEIHATPVPESGLGRAINERLRKAAAAPDRR